MRLAWPFPPLLPCERTCLCTPRIFGTAYLLSAASVWPRSASECLIRILRTPSTALKFLSKFFRKQSFSDQNQQPLNNVEPFERILRALLIAQCPYKFFSFLDLRNGSSRFRMFARDFRRFRFFFSGSACFSKVAPPGNLQRWVKYYGKFERFGKEFRWTKFNAVEIVSVHLFSTPR